MAKMNNRQLTLADLRRCVKENLWYNIDMGEKIPSIHRSDDTRPYEEIDHLQILGKGKGLSSLIGKFRDGLFNVMWRIAQHDQGKTLKEAPRKNLRITLVFHPDDPRQNNPTITHQILDGIRDIIAPITHAKTAVKSGDHAEISTSIVQDKKRTGSAMELHLRSHLKALQSDLGLKEITISEVQ